MPKSGGRLIQGIGITEWAAGECLFDPVASYFALSQNEGSDRHPERHYRSILIRLSMMASCSTMFGLRKELEMEFYLYRALHHPTQIGYTTSQAATSVPFLPRDAPHPPEESALRDVNL